MNSSDSAEELGVMYHVALEDQIKAIAKANKRRDGILKTVIDDLQQLDVDTKSRSQDLIKSLLKQFQSDMESLKSELFRKIKTTEESLGDTLDDSMDKLTKEFKNEIKNIVDPVTLRIESKIDDLRQEFQQKTQSILFDIDSKLDKNYRALKEEIQMMISRQSSENELGHVQTREFVESTTVSLSQQLLKLNLDNKTYTDSQFASIKSELDGNNVKLEDTLLRSLGSIVKEMKQQQSDNENRFKQLHSEIKSLNKRLEAAVVADNMKSENVDSLQQENQQLKQVIAIMRLEMENMDRNQVDNSMTEPTDSMTYLSEEEENISFAPHNSYSRPISPHKSLRERRSMPNIHSTVNSESNQKLLEMSNKLQAKVRKLSEELHSKNSIKGLQSKSVQVGLSAKQDADLERQRNSAGMVISKAKLVPKVKSQEPARIQIKPRRLIRNFNIKDSK